MERFLRRKYCRAFTEVGERFGMNYVVDVLLGSKNQKVMQNQHDTIKTYGIGETILKVAMAVVYP